MRRLYDSNTLNPTKNAQTLQNKVQFDIRFYFARRANENIDKFTKDTFKLQLDQNTGIRYITKQMDEQTKNHQDDLEFYSGHMPELKGSTYCPVTSFLRYVSKLHPQCDALWQQVKEGNLNDVDIWYKPRKIGPNPLGAFMSRISHAADLSRSYTNHSIRVTGTTCLSRFNFNPKQIMSVTGHRSVNSLAVYQKVSDDEKLNMGIAMSHYLLSDVHPGMNQQRVQQGNLRPILPRPEPTRQPSATVSIAQEETKQQEKENQIVEYEPEDPLLKEDFAQELNFDLSEYLKEIEEENMAVTQVEKNATVCTTYQRQMIKKSPKAPLFSNCKIGSIGNINIHFHKN